MDAHKQAQWDEELQQEQRPSKSVPFPPPGFVAGPGSTVSSRTIVVCFDFPRVILPTHMFPQVNKKPYSRMDMIGKGGSSRVYRVMTGNHDIFALKRVQLDRVDPDTVQGYMNEIALLKRLEGNQRIIRLIDSEVKPATAGSKGLLMLIMEYGEIDMAKLVQEQQKEPMDPVWVAYYWKQVSDKGIHTPHARILSRKNRCFKQSKLSMMRRLFILISSLQISCW